jgi:hypothetical protein
VKIELVLYCEAWEWWVSCVVCVIMMDRLVMIDYYLHAVLRSHSRCPPNSRGNAGIKGLFSASKSCPPGFSGAHSYVREQRFLAQYNRNTWYLSRPNMTSIYTWAVHVSSRMPWTPAYDDIRTRVNSRDILLVRDWISAKHKPTKSSILQRQRDFKAGQ